jgi:putative transposase
MGGLPDIDYPFHDKTIVVTRCGRICLGHRKINFSQVFAGQAVGIKEVHDDIWLVSFMITAAIRFVLYDIARSSIQSA